MGSKSVLKICLIVAALGVILFTAQRMFFAGNKPKNILLIVADTLRADHLGCYGFEGVISPNIDRLAEKGTSFTRFYTVVPSTLASFTSILTSLHPKDHGAFRNGIKADPSLPLLSARFRDGGYETAAFIASFCLSARFGMKRGFDHFDERYTKLVTQADNTAYRKAKNVTNSFINWVDERDEDEPFFAMVHFFDPHWPLDPPPQFMKMYGAKKLSETEFIERDADAVPPTGIEPNEGELNYHKLYCAEIRYMDHHIGRILDFLERTGMTEDTLVVFTSDHGETFWEHDDLFTHGVYVYNTNIHIPLIFHCPGYIPPGRVSFGPLSTLDLGPTLCRLAGLTPPPGFQGTSFAELLRSDQETESPRRPVFSEATMPWDAEEGAPRPNMLKAKCIVKDSWKFIDFPIEGGRRELYNIADDPRERRNLYGLSEHMARIEEFSALLDQWAKTYRTMDREVAPLSDEDQQKLKALGY